VLHLCFPAIQVPLQTFLQALQALVHAIEALVHPVLVPHFFVLPAAPGATIRIDLRPVVSSF
jgi:hypothetical protein